MSTGICEDCRFWDRLRESGEQGAGVLDDGNYAVTEGTGRCRRMPPSAMRWDLPQGWHSGDAAHGAYWPVTWDEDWCGEFEAAVRLTE